MSKYAAFHQTYQHRVRNLVSDVEVSSPYAAGEKITIRALWDTGATDTVITPYIAQTLSLTPVDRRKVSGVNSVRWSDVTRISILLPNGVSFGKKRALI
jgi:predicted aspartyl protease